MLSNIFFLGEYFITIVILVLSIAYFTLYERKLLAATQRRRGPNMVGFWGLLQAFADALKLLLKENLVVSGANYYLFILSPVLLFSFSLAVWSIIPLNTYNHEANLNYGLIVLMLFSSINSYFVVVAGASSNSRYSLLGGARAIAQVISYELPLTLSVFTLGILNGSFSLSSFFWSKAAIVLLAIPAATILFITLLAETNRTPFDLPEAEAELVAGYNLEYSAILFSMFFLAEYNNILVACSVFSMVFFSKFNVFFTLVLLSLFIIIRAILPRYTFAQLISLCWKGLLPLSIVYSFFAVCGSFLLGFNTNSLISGAADLAVCEILSVQSRGADGVLYIGGAEFWKVFFFFLAAFLFALLLFSINKAITRSRYNNRKNSAYECGFESFGAPTVDFEPNYIAIALMFLIYDVDVLLIFPFAAISGSHGFYSAAILGFFLLTTLFGLAYEITEGAVDFY